MGLSYIYRVVRNSKLKKISFSSLHFYILYLAPPLNIFLITLSRAVIIFPGVQFQFAMDSNPQPEEEEEECPICTDSLPKFASEFIRASCCGKGMHKKCSEDVKASSMSAKQKNQCVMCRTKYPGSEQSGSKVRTWSWC